MNTNFITY